VGFAVFCLYLLLAVISGEVHLGLNFLFIQLHPMKCVIFSLLQLWLIIHSFRISSTVANKPWTLEFALPFGFQSFCCNMLSIIYGQIECSGLNLHAFDFGLCYTKFCVWTYFQSFTFGFIHKTSFDQFIVTSNVSGHYPGSNTRLIRALQSGNILCHRWNGTLMNSFLFNVGLILACSIRCRALTFLWTFIAIGRAYSSLSTVIRANVFW
jgi:hypothetical protein